MSRDTRTLGLAGKLALLGALYVAQGLPFGFFMQTLPAYMRAQHYGLGQISNTTLLTLPWALKWLWAPLVDRWPAPTPTVRARRKRWILACQLLAMLVFGGLALTGAHPKLRVLFVGFLILNFVSATQDIGTDGLAVDTLVGKERGYANGIQVGGYRLGMVIGGGLLLLVLDEIGLQLAFASLAALTIALSAPLLLVREAPPVEKDELVPPRLPHFLTLPGVWRLLAVVASYKVAESLAAGVLRPFLVDRGHTLAEIGAISGVAGSTGGMLGALVGGALASRLPRKLALLSAGAMQTAMVLLFAVAAAVTVSRGEMAGIFFGEAFFSSLATATLFTVMMDYSRPIVSATDYTVQASCIVMATGLAALGSGYLAEHLGYVRHFVVCALVGLLSLAVLPLLPKPFRDGA
jgi:PAT family beta-lactamase induction signal transducer AmpG